MTSIFSPKAKGPSPETQRQQRRQAQAVDRQTADEAREAGRRRRIRAQNRQGGTLFSQAGAAGIRDTLG